MQKPAAALLIAVFAVRPAWPAILPVAADDTNGLPKAMAQARPGDQIVMADGLYGNRAMRFDARGTAESPIVVRPATPGGVVFTGRVRLAVSGENLVLRDFAFRGGKVSDKSIVLVENATNCRITACRFTGSLGKKNDQVIRVTGRSLDNRIDDCTFVSNEARAVQLHVDESWPTNGYPVGTRIDHNLFQDVPSVKHGESAANGRETIQLGQGIGGDCELKTVVEYNIFLRCNGENECISSKTAANTYRYNSFKDQGGCLSLRGSAKCVVEGNRFENTPGIHVQGRGHTIVHNVLIRSGGTRKPGRQSVAGSIALGYGMAWNPDSPYPQHYKPAQDCLVANNTIVDPPLYGLVLGGGRDQDWHTKGVRNVPPSGNRVVNNLMVSQTGELLIEDAAPDNIVDHNLVFAGGPATVPFYGDHPIKAAPRFVDAAAGDYRLAPGSPGLGAGLELDAVPHSTNVGAAAEPVAYGPVGGKPGSAGSAAAISH
jgi:poly(beta-D-mannuronate) lyase